jgi:hypothetical protein
MGKGARKRRISSTVKECLPPPCGAEVAAIRPRFRRPRAQGVHRRGTRARISVRAAAARTPRGATTRRAARRRPATRALRRRGHHAPGAPPHEAPNLPSQCDDLINLRLWHNRVDGLKVAGKDARTEHKCDHGCQKNAGAHQAHSAELISSDRPLPGWPPHLMLNV